MVELKHFQISIVGGIVQNNQFSIGMTYQYEYKNVKLVVVAQSSWISVL